MSASMSTGCAAPIRRGRSPMSASAEPASRQNLLLAQHFFQLEGEAKDLQPRFTLADLAKHDFGLTKPGANPPTLYPPHDYDTYEWAMVIDNAACIGCNACVVACQAENNVPIVGPEQIAVGRDMHWLRDRRLYRRRQAGLLAGALHALRARALRTGLPGGGVGPRQRRAEPAGLQSLRRHPVLRIELSLQGAPLQFLRLRRRRGIRNRSAPTSSKRCSIPNVTVRGRGVMEKCTYCVQRISRARRAAEKEHRTIRDGEVVTACQAACPTRAISFGDLTDPNSRINALRARAAATRCSAISARVRAPLIWPGCRIPIRILGAISHERCRDPQRADAARAGALGAAGGAQSRCA